MCNRLFLMLAAVFLLSMAAFSQGSGDSTRKDSTIRKPIEVIKLKEVGIIDKLRPHHKTHIAVTLSEQQLQLSSGGGLAESIKEIPGVSMLKTGSTISKPVIEGMHGNRILILNNGIRLEGQQWGLEHAPEIDPLLAKRIHVVKGAESVRYGAEAMGGVIVVEPPALPNSAGISGLINLIGASNGRSGVSSAMLNGGLKSLPGFGWRVQGTLKKAGNVRSASYYLGNTGLSELNYTAALGYDSGKSIYEVYYSHFEYEPGILYSAHVGTKEDIEARIAIGRPLETYGFTYQVTAPRQKIQHDLVKVKAHYHLNDAGSVDLVYGYQRNHRMEYDFRRGNREALPITDLVLNTHTLDVVFEAESSKGSKQLYGFNGLLQVNDNVPGTLSNTFIPNYDGLTAGVFAIQHWQKNDFEFEAGLRYDFKLFDAAGYRYTYLDESAAEAVGQYYGGVRKFHNVTGTLGMFWKINPFLQLNSNLGMAWRAPTANELFSKGLHHGAGIYEVGNSDIKSEQGYKWISTLKFSAGRLDVSLGAYAQYIQHYIYTQPDQSFKQTVSGTYPVFRYKQTNASFAGLDLSGSYRFSDILSYHFKTAAIRARDLTGRQYLPYIPADRIDHHIRFTFKKSGNTWLQGGHSYVLKQRRYTAGSDYAAPPDAYHLIQLSAGTMLKISKEQLDVNVSADNLFNALYKDYMNRYRYYAHDAGRNITIRAIYKF